MTVAGGRALSMSGGGASASRPATYAARLRSPRSERKARTSAGPAKNQNDNTRYLRPLALGLVFALGVVLGVDLGMAFAFFGFAFSLRGASSALPFLCAGPLRAGPLRAGLLRAGLLRRKPPRPALLRRGLRPEGLPGKALARRGR